MGFQQGLSGLSSAATNLDVIGNNVANASTVGFKSSTAQFADVYATSLYGTGGIQIGIGTKVADVAQNFTQGTVTVTNSPLDIAISGEGFFQMVQDGAISYTRNGQFSLDKDGFIVNNGSLQLTGWGLDASGNIVGGTPIPLQISQAPSPPKSTTEAILAANLDSGSTLIPAATAINPSDATTFDHTTSVTVYDEGGNPQSMVLYFQHNSVSTGATPTSSWTVAGYVNGTQVDLNGAAAGNNLAMVYDGAGILDAATGINGAAPVAFDVTIPASVLNTGANPLTFSLDMTDFTQYGSSFSVSTLSQDGYSSGRLASLSVASDGTIQGRYTNGQNKVLGQIVTQSFLNPNGLQSIGNNQWVQTADSGPSIPGAPGSGVLGTLQSGAVEDSNVDLTAELVNMIVAQRMYQANAQTIKTQDQIFQTLVNLR